MFGNTHTFAHVVQLRHPVLTSVCRHEEAVCALRFQVEEVLLKTHLQHSSANTVAAIISSSPAWKVANEEDKMMLWKAVFDLVRTSIGTTIVVSLAIPRHALDK